MPDGDERLDVDRLLGDTGTDSAPIALDLLSSGDDQPGAVERGRSWLRETVMPRLHRHRKRLSVACLVLLVGAGVAVYWRTRPPAEDPVVHVAFVPVPAAGQRDSLGLENLYRTSAQTMTADYLTQVETRGDVVDVESITGPGLSPIPATGQGHATYSAPAAVSLSARVTCTQPGWWTARDSDYAVRVTRSDAYDRVLRTTVPLDARNAAAWHAALRRECLSPVLAAMTFDHWIVAADRATAKVALTVRVTNPDNHQVYLQFGFPRDPVADGPLPPTVLVPGNGTSVLHTRWPVESCSAYPFGLLVLFGPDDPSDLIAVRVGTARFGPPDAEGQDPYQNAVTIPHAVRLRLQGELDRACTEARRTR